MKELLVTLIEEAFLLIEQAREGGPRAIPFPEIARFKYNLLFANL